jgi:CheY-like chemotaxis protein
MGILDNIRVLVVDDETDLRDILQEEFEALGAKVVTANNGKEAFELVKKNELDFVVTDVRMPVGDGVELLDNIRAHNRTIPVVIFLTGFSDLTNDIAFHKGAAAIFSKPFDIEAVAETISKFMKKPEER